MTSFVDITAVAQAEIEAANGDQQAILAALVKQAVALVDEATEHGQLTRDDRSPRAQSYWIPLYEQFHETGFYVLGSGFFSFVLSHVLLVDRVIKVGLKKEDSAAAYTAWSRMNQGRVGVPNVYATKRSTGCYVVVLDELYPLDTDKLKEFRAFRAARAGVHGFDGDAWSNPEGDETLNALHATGAAIREFFKGLARFDLHEENVMVDAQGNVVITDPVSYAEGVAEGSSWCLIEHASRLNDIQRERIAEKARQRHQRNRQRQEIRKRQKEAAKKRRMLAAKTFGVIDGKIAADAVLYWRQPSGFLILEPEMPLGERLSQQRTELLKLVQHPPEVPKAVIKQFCGEMDGSLDKQFLMG